MGNKGLYVACKFDRQSIVNIKALCKLLDIEQLDSDSIHSTICYSRKPCNKPFDDAVLCKSDCGTADIVGLEIFSSRDGGNVLVALLDSQFLRDQHNRLMKDYELSYDFEQYRPHVTLTYDYPSDVIPELPSGVDTRLRIATLYAEDLNEEWTP